MGPLLARAPSLTSSQQGAAPRGRGGRQRASASCPNAPLLFRGSVRLDSVMMLRTTSPEETAAKRSEQRLDVLYWRFAGEAVQLAFLITGDRHAAEDIVQDAFVRLFGRYLDLRSPEAFEVYLRRTVVNLSRDRFRRLRLERDWAARSRSDAREVDDGSQIEDRAVIRQALQRLPHRQRAALVLRYYVDLSEEQTADVLRCSVPAVKSLITRATGSLRKQMRGETQ